MLTPRYLEGMPEEVIELYSALECDILQDMARRVASLGGITEATKYQARLLRELGTLKKHVARILAKYSREIRHAVERVYLEALNESVKNDNKIYMQEIGRNASINTVQRLGGLLAVNYDTLERLTRTTASSSELLFIKTANEAFIRTNSGAFSYNRALKLAVDDMAAQGVTMVQYENGRPVRRSIEAAVRVNIITGVNQTASAVSMDNAQALGCDLVEVSAHAGARPEHAAWQGKIYSLSGKSDRYPPFSVCGLGSVTGICGANCRHSYAPYFEGMKQQYNNAELKEMAGEKVYYNGEKISEYDAEQQLRAYERQIRKYKRKALTERAAGLDDTQAREYLGKWQAKARDLVKQTNIKRDYSRERVGTKGEQPRAARPKPKEK